MQAFLLEMNLLGMRTSMGLNFTRKQRPIFKAVVWIDASISNSWGAAQLPANVWQSPFSSFSSCCEEALSCVGLICIFLWVSNRALGHILTATFLCGQSSAYRLIALSFFCPEHSVSAPSHLSVTPHSPSPSFFLNHWSARRSLWNTWLGNISLQSVTWLLISLLSLEG